MYRDGLAQDPPVHKPIVNGLATIPEMESICLREESVAPFSMPEDVLSFVPEKSATATVFKNGAKERNLYSNNELTDLELQSLKCIQQEAQLQGLSFFPSVASSVMRYLGRSSGDAKRALKEMLATQDWRKAYFKSGPITDSAIAEDMAHGIVYFCGRDQHLRPALIIRPSRIPASWRKNKETSWRVIRLLVFSLEYLVRYLVYPGKVETSTIIVDFKGVTTAHLQHKDAIREICTVLGRHYIYRVHRFYMCNVPSMIHKAGWMFTCLLTERAQQKLNFVKSGTDLHRDFALHQLEEDLGGTQPTATLFFPFPLQAGPFAAGCVTGADANAVSHMHRAFTAAGLRGRAWNPELSRDENEAVEQTELAKGMFERCRVPASRRREAPVLLGVPMMASAAKDAWNHERNIAGIVFNASPSDFGDDLTSTCGDSPVEKPARVNKVLHSSPLRTSFGAGAEFRGVFAHYPVLDEREVRPLGSLSCSACSKKV